MASSTYVTPWLSLKLKVLGFLTAVLIVLLVMSIVMATKNLFRLERGEQDE